MRLLINTATLRFGGAVQVALSLIHECVAIREHQYFVVLGPGLVNSVDTACFPPNFQFERKSFGPIGLGTLNRVAREMSSVEERIRPDCVVTTSGPAYWRSTSPHLMGFNLPLYIYPESPYLRNLGYAAKAKLSLRKMMHRHFFRRDADAIIVQTDDVNERVRRFLKKDLVHTVSNTHNAWFERPEHGTRKLPKRKEGLFRLLTLSSYYPHKNLDLIPRIIDILPDRLKNRVEFVLTLTESQFLDYVCKRVPPQVRLTGPVKPSECPSLYAECDAMFLPTLAECFSASYPEAMKMEKPIITTDLGFSRSICGEAALFFSPCDPRSAARQIEKLVCEPALQQALVKQGQARLGAFDGAAQRAQKIVSICEELCSAGQVDKRSGVVG